MEELKKVHISVLGCSLIDYIYAPVSFSSASFRRYTSLESGDGGLEPGKLVFTENLEAFSEKNIETILAEIIGNTAPKAINIGGPGIVSAICAAQLLQNSCYLSFYGGRGNDATGKHLMQTLSSYPIDVENLVQYGGSTANTYVLSDPNHEEGYGERAFIFNIGVLKGISLSDIPEKCYEADIVLFGATAVMPNIHANLDVLLQKSKDNGALTIVITVYDFLQEQQNPDKKWNMGSSEHTYALIDLLVCDQEEAFRLSGTENIEQAIAYFKNKGVKATIITRGKDDVVAYATSVPFRQMNTTYYPVSELINEEIRAGKALEGDTTGCGDNFAGGVLSSIAMQKTKSRSALIDLEDAIIWGTAAGGAACFHLGGTYIEKYPGEKRAIVERYYLNYKEKQII